MPVYKKTPREIAYYLNAAMSGGSSDSPVYRIEYDSRKAERGDIFVCLTGYNSDGHSFAPMAYRSGCRVFLCERDPGLPNDAVLLLVPDTRSALASLSAYFYDFPANKLSIAGITGTKGKTTTSLMLASILNRACKSCAYIGSNGVIIGSKRVETVNTTPESRDLHHYFAMMVQNGIKYAAIEVSSQALAHNRVEGIPFAQKVFLNLSPDHIGGGEHKDYGEYKAAKASFFNGYSGDIIYNLDDAESLSVISGCDPSAEKISFGMGDDADFCGLGGDLYKDDHTLGVTFTCKSKARNKVRALSTEVRLRSPGSFSIYNALAALSCAERFGVPIREAAEYLSEVSVTGRFEIVPGLSGRTYIIDYAHNGESMRRALTALREYSPSRLIVVFGSVGGRTQGRRRELAEAVSSFADLAIITSDNPDNEDPINVINDIAKYMSDSCPYIKIADRNEAVRRAVRISESGDIVFFAGKGHETYQLICGKKEPFCERDIIEDECAKISAEAKGGNDEFTGQR